MAKFDREAIAVEYNKQKEILDHRGINADDVKDALKKHQIETPSWGYGASGTRFKVFHQPGEAKDVYEKISAAARVHTLTGVTPTVALHIPWDKPEGFQPSDFKQLKEFAESKGISIGSINANLFEDDDYKLGSITNTDDAIRRKALDHMFECIEIMEATGSTIFSFWVADGTNYPGQGNFRRRKRWVEECLAEVHERLPDDCVMLVEYKVFEPGFYHTDIADYGIALNICKKLGEKAYVLVDLGHHPQGTNIEHIVAYLIDEGKLGGFHFNSKKYADDDLTVGSINPYELFLIYNELVDGELDPSVKMNVAYMIDQSHNIKPKVEAMVQSIDMCQQGYARALIVEREKLTRAQEEGDVVEAEQTLLRAFRTEVTPIIAMARLEMGVPADPLRACRESA